MAIRSLRRTVLGALKRTQASTSSLLETHNSLSNYCAEPLTSASLSPSSRPNFSCNSIYCRRLSSPSEEAHGPAAINYSSVLQEDEYNKLANSTIHDLLDKLEEYGDSVEIDGYDVDYGVRNKFILNCLLYTCTMQRLPFMFLLGPYTQSIFSLIVASFLSML
ncbi:hypothetical protein ACS0TY_017561 [Phlomoides rotata]